MAVTRAEGVIRATTTGDTVDGSVQVNAVKVVNGAGGTGQIQLRSNDASGGILWESIAVIPASSEVINRLTFKAKDGIYVTSAGLGSPVVYLYTD